MIFPFRPNHFTRMPTNLTSSSESYDETVTDMKSFKPSNSNLSPFKSHWLRYPIFLTFMLLNLDGIINISSYIPLYKFLMRNYGLSYSMVILSSTMFIIGIVISCCILYYSRKYLTMGQLIRISVLIHVIGVGLKLLIHTSFFFILAGQFFIGMAISFYCHHQIEICHNWFSVKSRRYYRSVLSIMIYLGVGCSSYKPLLFFDLEEHLPRKKFFAQMDNYIWLSAYVSLGICSVFMFVFRESPPPGYG